MLLFLGKTYEQRVVRQSSQLCADSINSKNSALLWVDFHPSQQNCTSQTLPGFHLGFGILAIHPYIVTSFPGYFLFSFLLMSSSGAQLEAELFEQ